MDDYWDTLRWFLREEKCRELRMWCMMQAELCETKEDGGKAEKERRVSWGERERRMAYRSKRVGGGN